MKVSAIIVTRGNVDLSEIVDSMVGAVDEIVIWDNSQRQDFSVYGRYAAIDEAANDVIYVQDDDCLIDVAEVISHYQPARLVANMPQSRWRDYPDSAMVGWGAVFDRVLPEQAHELFGIADEGFTELELDAHSNGNAIDVFYRTCDVIFSSLVPRTVIDIGFEHLPWAEGPDRMFTTDPVAHKRERDFVLNLCRTIRVWPDDDRRIERA